MYQVKIFRHEYALYAAWEYGFHHANRLIKQTTFERGATVKRFKLKREANAFAERVRQIVCWQRGRLNMTAKCPDVFVN